MPRILTVLLVASLLSAGCASLNKNSEPLPRAANGQPPTTDQLVAHLNQNAKGISSLEFYQVSIEAKQGLQQFGVDGNLVYQKPHNFRLMAHALGTTEADVGSNDKEFWFWFKRNDPPALYHCSYEEFPQCRNLNIPMHPDWLAEALCVNELGSASQYQIRTVGSVYELHSQTTTPQGQPLEKVIKVASTGANAGKIVGYQLKSPQGQDLWTAEVKDYRNIGGWWVPFHVTLKCHTDKDKLQLDFTLNKPHVNGLKPGSAVETFTRPNYPKEIDLARGPGSLQSIQRTSAAAR
jgi:hypothetical protein